eukprot:TRINITY_DN59806_c0_g1_i1.p1 TRINITY_DN59806_c0_g1~~TRINITY_DN59806_c0_g1_i1.p1  ORF type:complete len:433 (-),score=99.50 TRINITY_DN59806_c0_g1_i1:53-1351(-)
MGASLSEGVLPECSCRCARECGDGEVERAVETSERSPSASSRGSTYVVTLDRSETPGFSVGFEVDQCEDLFGTVSLEIKVIEAGGLADRWNVSHPMEMIQPGDRVLDVNGTMGDAELMRLRCETDKVLRLTLARFDVCSPQFYKAGGAGPSKKRAFVPKPLELRLDATESAITPPGTPPRKGSGTPPGAAAKGEGYQLKPLILEERVAPSGQPGGRGLSLQRERGGASQRRPTPVPVDSQRCRLAGGITVPGELATGMLYRGGSSEQGLPLPCSGGLSPDGAAIAGLGGAPGGRLGRLLEKETRPGRHGSRLRVRSRERLSTLETLPEEASSEALDQLTGMGFEREKAQNALDAGGGSVEQAVVLLAAPPPATTTAPSCEAESAQQGEAHEAARQELMNMGFPEAEAVSALSDSHGDVERAAAILVSSGCAT